MFENNLFGVGRATLYQSLEKHDTIPTTGWTVVDGVDKPPTISLNQPKDEASGELESRCFVYSGSTP